MAMTVLELGPDLSKVETEKLLAELIRRIGDDPGRPGLLETPTRIKKSWNELFSGYKSIPLSSILKTFDPENHTFDEIILLKDIEFFSMCEHHMLPFFGKAHVAYIPGPSGKIVGVSKLARLVDYYARRLQVQERLGLQVAEALYTHTQATGAACILEAEHLCMRMRGVNKQNSTMKTSALLGAFKTDPSTRSELLALIEGRR